ncbi:hypothetical protein FNV43_RR11123 [Rhamnella rubrinervis]|uniref:Uncharacterized protein n=1 Tax=Rhamnella rubrinervis TaxID=2594499 RepID=A0A8K0H586_9ROSA|nr:hypothetical protein FNV43_RR11123 [Rhamnella rubrinervis]
MVEEVAEDVEKVADDIGDHLPDGTKLRKADLFVENVAKEIVKDANLAEQVILKVEDVETYAGSFIGLVDNEADKTISRDKCQ